MNIGSSKRAYRLTAEDGWRMIVILVLYGILSFFHLGSMQAPQTTWYVGDLTTSMVLDLGSKQEIGYLRQLTGARFGKIQVAISDDNINYSEIGEIEQKKVFAWQDMDINLSGRYIRLTANDEKASISEVAFFTPNGQRLNVVGTDEASSLLVDEQSAVPDEISYMNTTYFDEIYHARTAYEYANDMTIYEWTHPPLGKLIMSIPIRLFGMTPFNYRVMGNLTGLLMLIVIYVFAKRMFKSTKYATLAMLLFAVDGMHFVQTRIGTVDSYLVLFIMLAYLFMYQYISCSDKQIGRMHFNLLASGFFMGCAIATKWNGAYCAIGLAIIFFINLFIRNSRIGLTGRWNEHRGKIILGCFGYFIIIPCLIYIISYVPDMRINPEIGTLKGFINLQIRMFNYHSKLTATHPFGSPWYLWPLGIKPVWYYDGQVAADKVSSIALHSNPFIWWTGILAMVYSLYRVIIERSKNSVFIVIAILAAYVPYVGVTRVMFLYHYFPVVPMMILAIVAMIKDIEENSSWRITVGYSVIAILVFAFFYPIYSGLEIPRWYAEKMIWLKGVWKLF